MPGSRLGRWSLRLDAVYCLVTGLLVLGTAPLTATAVGLPAAWIAAVGALTVVWSGIVWQLSRRPLVPGLRLVLVANTVASCGIAVFSLTASGLLALLTLLAIAVEVGGFAASQAVALRRLAHSAPQL